MSLAQAATDLAALVRGCIVSGSDGRELPQEEGVGVACDLLANVRERGGKVYLVGNGGSAAVASHVVTDLCNGAALCAATLHEPSLLTCYTNDYGYEQAFARLVARVLHPRDLLVAISSSGRSPNIYNAVAAARELGAQVVTLSGFYADNPLRALGEVNFWLDSGEYGAVEVGHLFILHHLAERLGARP